LFAPLRHLAAFLRGLGRAALLLGRRGHGLRNRLLAERRELFHLRGVPARDAEVGEGCPSVGVADTRLNATTMFGLCRHLAAFLRGLKLGADPRSLRPRPA
jgi:hypothetical protein